MPEKWKTRRGFKQLNVEVSTYTKDTMLPKICAADKRSQANMIEWLIERRYGETK
jgi:hypothetical protein